MTDTETPPLTLLPCPWCATLPEVRSRPNRLGDRRWFVTCEHYGELEDGGCPVSPFVGGDTCEDAVTRWNQRKDTA